MSHSCRALVLSLSLAACSNPKAPEAPAASSASVADAGVSAASPSNTATAAAETLFVRGATASCQGEAEQRCWVVRGSPREPWRNLYAPIEGFAPDAAFDYELRVEVSSVAGAPPDAPDAPALRYRLLEVIAKHPAAVP